MIALIFASLALASEPQIYFVRDQGQLELAQTVDFQNFVTETDWLVLGERHNTDWVQEHQAKWMAYHAEINSQDWALAWEFLPYTQDQQIQSAWQKLLEGTLSVEGVLREWFSPQSETVPYATYIPVLETLAKLNRPIVTTNLSRQEKSPVVKDGLGALDPALMPPDFIFGSDAYRGRFEAIMGGHTNPESLANYFAAQVLTDEVMAHQITLRGYARGTFIVGSFHSDYFDGVVASLKRRLPSTRTIGLVRYVDLRDLENSSLEEIAFDLRWGGRVADVLVVK